MEEPQARKLAEELFSTTSGTARVLVREGYHTPGCLMGLFELGAMVSQDQYVGTERNWTELQLQGPRGEVLARKRMVGHHHKDLLPVVAARFDRGPLVIERGRAEPRVLQPEDWLLPRLRGSVPQALSALRAAGAEISEGETLTARFHQQGRHWTPLVGVLALCTVLVVLGPLGWGLGALLLLVALLVPAGRTWLRSVLRPLWAPSDEWITLTLDADTLRVLREITDMPPVEKTLSRYDLLAILPGNVPITRDTQPIPSLGSQLRKGRARGPALLELLRARWGLTDKPGTTSTPTPPSRTSPPPTRP
jgi:hypothetical protein